MVLASKLEHITSPHFEYNLKIFNYLWQSGKFIYYFLQFSLKEEIIMIRILNATGRRISF